MVQKVENRTNVSSGVRHLLVSDFLDFEESTLGADVFVLQLLSSIHNRRSDRSAAQKD